MEERTEQKKALPEPTELQFTEFTPEDVAGLRDYYHLRPNRSCDNSPLDTYLWQEYYDIRRCVVNEEAVLMVDQEAGELAGCIPLCREERLPEYFRLQERYFNEVLKKPFKIYFADEAGVSFLKEQGLLEHYEIREEEDLRDYLYEGDALRTLAGRKLSKKRNHIHRFEKEYEGRWEYRPLGLSQKAEILSFLTEWEQGKDAEGEGQGIAPDESSYDALESLHAEVEGVEAILKYPCVFQEVRAGGIYIDGRLRAFSMGTYNPYEEMAIIDIEKADPDIDGLYQMINQQFLLHAFPEAKLVNREDDVGLPGLRRSKLSYYPIGYARTFALYPKDFPKAP